MYKTPVRAFEAVAESHDFRVYGQLHLPARVGTVALLNQRRSSLPLTACRVCRRSPSAGSQSEELLYRQEFLALGKERLRWVAGGEPDPPQPGVRREERRVALLFADYLLAGTLQVTPGSRISDFAAAAGEARPFHGLFELELRQPRAGAPLSELPLLGTYPFAAVNLAAADALFDSGAAAEIDPGPG